MNRTEEIRAKALDVAHHVTDDPFARSQMADDLIELIGLMVAAVSEDVARGEYEDTENESLALHTVGRRMRQEVTSVVEESTVAHLPDWAPRCRECGKRECK